MKKVTLYNSDQSDLVTESYNWLTKLIGNLEESTWREGRRGWVENKKYFKLAKIITCYLIYLHIILSNLTCQAHLVNNHLL